MPDWEQLITVGVADAWRVVKNEVAKELFPGLLAVPHLLQADYYDLMVCFTKCPTSVMSKIVGEGPVYRLHGHIADLVSKEHTDIPELVVMCQHPSKEDLHETNFTRTWTRGDRTIMVKLGGLSKLVTNWTIGEGKLVMDKSFEELADVAKVYIISEVVFAETVIVEVDTKKKSEASEMKRIPVAFSYFKFPMNTEGVLQAGTDKVNKDADFLLIEEIEKI